MSPLSLLSPLSPLPALACLALLLALLVPRLCPLLWADLRAFLTMALCSWRCRRRLARCPPRALLDIFQLRARSCPGKPFLLFQDETLSYGHVDAQSTRLAWALWHRCAPRPAQVVAVFMPNSPAYVWTWLALAKLGCAMACVNSNARGTALCHALRASGASVVIVSPELQVPLEEVLPSLAPSGLRLFYLSRSSPTEGVEPLMPLVEGAPTTPLPAWHRQGITPDSKALYIFTSGTTGLPKAAVVTELKLMMAASLARMCGLRRDDVVYTTLPLYHSAGLMVGIGGVIDVGATCALRAKFSASQFWPDCRRYGVTVIQYVGELMRYLCNTAPRPDDARHGVRLAMGNGLRADVWRHFRRRFGPVAIREFYGATEGNAGFINYTGTVGAVGRANPFIRRFAPFELIRYDVDLDQPIRDERGLCVPVAAGEPGLLVVKITGATPFHGYAGDEQKTLGKVLRNVLAEGDSYFNSGDLLVMDPQGFLFFHDRVGDTFRWKGENVATTEVEATLASVPFIQEVNVYGVAVPGCEGRCGMAAIRLRDGATFDGHELFAFTRDTLPGYASPRFVRVQDALEITGTFKQCKTRLVQEGFDPGAIRDPLYFRDDAQRAFVPLTPGTFRDIQEQRISL